MKIAVLGSGKGGCGVAFDWAQHGHEVRLFDFEQFPANVEAVAANGGIRSTGQLEGWADIAYAGHDIGLALEGADLVFAVGPAYSTEPIAAVAAPHLRPGQRIVICPSACAGSLVFKRALGLSHDDSTYNIGETNTLPYAVRVTEPGTINVFLKLRAGLMVAATPRAGTAELQQALAEVYPGIASADSVLQTTLQNGNPVIHPAVTLLNAALIERTGGAFDFYEDGITDAVGRLIENVDRERLALAAQLGLTVRSDPAMGVLQGYMEQENYTTAYSTAPGFLGIRAQSRLDNRYLTEDVGYSMVFLVDLGRQLGVPTPVMDAIIEIASVALARDFRGEQKRTMATLGLSDYSREQLSGL
ncbi:MAG: NAD/NADP octopine/nopaline dehydrogenase family protein [Jatrophihabitans sp.]